VLPDILRVYLRDLAHGAAEATGVADEIDGRRRNITGTVDDVRTTWTGPAARAYLSVWEEIDDECVKMLADLRWIGDSLTASAKAYAAMEQGNAEALHAVDPRAV
jgi:WXG100 family type VII secretion target